MNCKLFLYQGNYEYRSFYHKKILFAIKKNKAMKGGISLRHIGNCLPTNGIALKTTKADIDVGQNISSSSEN